jgi:hypothetical protein
VEEEVFFHIFCISKFKVDIYDTEEDFKEGGQKRSEEADKASKVGGKKTAEESH